MSLPVRSPLPILPNRLIRPIPVFPIRPIAYPPHALAKTIHYTVESHVSLGSDLRHGRRVDHHRA
jgi:hypothetical protein